MKRLIIIVVYFAFNLTYCQEKRNNNNAIEFLNSIPDSKDKGLNSYYESMKIDSSLILYPDKIFNSNRLNVKLNTTALIDEWSFPTLEIAIEKKIGNSYSVQFETGVQLFELYKSDADTVNIKNSGFRFRIEARYYLKNNTSFSSSSNKTLIFTGLNLIYRKNTYNTNFSYLSEGNSNELNFIYLNDNIGVDKTVYGANALIGLKFFLSNKIYIEPVSYLGLINRKIKNIDRESPYQENLQGKISARSYRDLAESSGLEMNLGLALRIGIKL